MTASARSERRALVIGASRGIGAAIARRLDDDGFEVGIVGRDQSGLHDTLSSLGRGWMTTADVSTNTGRSTLMKSLEDEDRVPHVVVGVVHVRRPWSRITRTEPGDYGASVDEHLGYLATVAKRVVPFQRGEGFGRWVFISSLVASMGGHGQGVYVAQKAATEAFSRTLALEEAPYGITSNVVVPGFILTDNMGEHYTDEQRTAFAGFSAVNRPGAPDEVAHAVSFLADERAGFVTGASIPVTGGAELNWWLVRGMNNPVAAAEFARATPGRVVPTHEGHS